ncbi:unnamed protein product, partial [Ascophyllum nodosum]
QAKKVVSDDDAKKALSASYDRFKGEKMDLGPAISKVDKTLSCIDMGVRSMKATGPDGVMYHCVVNKVVIAVESLSGHQLARAHRWLRLSRQSPDEVAKLYGSKLVEWQVEAFKTIIDKFGKSEDDQLLRLPELQSDIKSRQKNMTNEMIQTFAEQLVEDFWLARPHNSAGYRLGVRTFVELPELLKSYDLSIPQVF